MLKKILFLIISLLIATTINAQSEEHIFKNYDTQNGLCDNNINSILEDDKGFIWIGTREGLSRFDGAEFRNFFLTPENGYTGSYSWLHKLDSNKILLLQNFKLVVLNTADNSLQTVAAFKNKRIIEITQLSPKVYALNALDHFILIDNQLKYIGKIKIPGKIYNAIFIRKLNHNQFLIGNCFEYYLYDLVTQKITPFGINMRKYQDKNFNLFELKYVDPQEQKIYISDYFTGLYVFDFNGNLLNRFHKDIGSNSLSSSNFIAFVKSTDGSIWLGTHNGINVIKNKTVEIIQHHDENDLSLKSNVITSFLSDKNNNIWIGTNQGLSVYKSKLKSKIGSISISDNANINTIAISGKELFAGSYLDKIYKINTETKKTSVLQNETRVWGIYNYNENIYITGANPQKEVWDFNPKTNQFSTTDFLKKLLPNSDIITLVYQHSNGDFWYSGNAGGGFVRKPMRSDKPITYYKDLKGNPLFSSSYYSNICEDADKNLWFGVNRTNLLLQWNFKTNTFREINFNNYKETRNYVFGGITGLKIDAKNFIWVSFEGGGIIQYNPRNNTVKHYDFAKGLNSNFINAIELDPKGRVWLLTDKGIGCLDAQTNTFYAMDIWDGFVDNPINYNVLKMDSVKNIMWIGAKQKLYYFNPDIILKNKKTTTKIYLDYFKVNQINVNTAINSFDFKPNENNLEFRLVAVDIETGKNLEYSYQLEGLSPQWHDLESNRTIFIQKLKAGNYSFNARVKTKGSKEWIYLSKPYAFKIANYWYETWWFIILSTIAFVLLIWLVIWFNFKKKLEKQKAVEEERNRIAIDMHDDLGSGLTKITYLSQMALQKENNKELLSSIKNTSTELVESMSEIIWAMKEDNNSWEELLSYLKLYAQDYGQNNQLKVHFVFPAEEMNFKIIGEVRRHIFLSVKECLHNIVKHANAQNITIVIEKESTINISIQDDGKGMTTNSENHIGGNGLKNIRKRMEIIEAQFTIINGNGTTILFQIPY